MPPRRLRKRRSILLKPRTRKVRKSKPARRRPRTKNDRQKLIEWARDLKKRPCTDCKRLYPSVCMDWDHLPQHKKRFTISSFIRENAHLPNARRLVEVEIAKCELVCSNCHRIRTAKRARSRLNRWW